MTRIAWSEGSWTHPPVSAIESGGDLLVTAAEGSDAWRRTSYGFINDSEHALLAPLGREDAVEVDFTAAFREQFDQAGVFLRVSAEQWIKAGVEFADGSPQLGAVVTNEYSDWSLAPVPTWIDRRVTVRASRTGDAVTVRARCDGEDFRLVRVIPLAPELEVHAGPFVCAPTRAGLTVPLHEWRRTAPDASLH